MFGATNLLNLAGHIVGAKKGVCLQSERLHLVPYTSNLVTVDHVAWLSDPVLMRYSENRHHKHTVKSQRAYLDSFPGDSFIWLIRANDTLRPGMIDSDVNTLAPGARDLGSISAYIDPYNGVADMGILLAKAQGQGFGLEAWQRVMLFLIGGDIRKIECGCRADNGAMKRIASKSNMRYEGTRPWHFLNDNDSPVDLDMYGYVNDRWNKENPPGCFGV
jgi:RimJ/RimL family protein N-acetyltransferase